MKDDDFVDADVSVAQVIFALEDLVKELESCVTGIENTVAECLGTDIDADSMATIQRIDYVRQSLGDLHVFLNNIGTDFNTCDGGPRVSPAQHLSSLKLESSRLALNPLGYATDKVANAELDLF